MQMDKVSHWKAPPKTIFLQYSFAFSEKRLNCIKLYPLTPSHPYDDDDDEEQAVGTEEISIRQELSINSLSFPFVLIQRFVKASP